MATATIEMNTTDQLMAPDTMKARPPYRKRHSSGSEDRKVMLPTNKHVLGSSMMGVIMRRNLLTALCCV